MIPICFINYKKKSWLIEKLWTINQKGKSTGILKLRKSNVAVYCLLQETSLCFLYHFYLNVDNILYPVFTLSPFHLNNAFIILCRFIGICDFLCVYVSACAYLCVKYPNIAHVQITLYVVYFTFVDFPVHSLYAWGEFDYGMPLQQNHENERKRK